jgi:CheY-like chemotaxis protein
MSELPRAKQGEVILAVDDDRCVRIAVVQQLKDLGYRVIEADDGKAALARLAAEKVDLLFSDIVMPGAMTGIELADKAMAEWPDLKILLTSGFAGRPAGTSTTGQIMHRLLGKPYRKQALAIAVREALDGPAG